jgi:hypothetical protein
MASFESWQRSFQINPGKSKFLGEQDPNVGFKTESVITLPPSFAPPCTHPFLFEIALNLRVYQARSLAIRSAILILFDVTFCAHAGLIKTWS